MEEIKFRYVYKSKELDNYEFDFMSIEEIESGKFRKRGLFYFLLSRNRFTGLQDVPGKDIYEGDIVDVDIPFKNNAIMIVKKYLSEMLLSFNLDEEDTDCMFRFKDVGELKIIGNIYENPELLA